MSIQLSRILITVGVAYLMLGGEGSRAAASSQADELGSLGMIIEIYDESDGLVLDHRKGRTSQYEPICVNKDYKVEVWVVAFLIWNNIESDNALVVRGEWRVEAGGQDIIPPQATGGRLENVGNRVTQAAIFSYRPTEKGLDSLIFWAPQVRHPETRVVQSVREVVTLKVEDCPLNTSMIYQGYYQGEGFALAYTGWMDEVELTPVDEQHYAGSGTFYMNTIYIIPGCSLSHTTYTVLTTINAVSSEETLALTFESELGEVVLSGQCGGYGLSAVQPAASLADFGLGQVTLPPEGGVVNVLDSASAGTFTIIVTREAEEEAIPVSDAGGPTGGLPAWLILADTSQ